MFGKGRSRLLSLLGIWFVVELSWSFACITPMEANAEENQGGRVARAGQLNTQQRVRASKIIDHVVYNEKDEEIGEVDDLIMTRSGRIKKAVLSVGEFLGTGERLVAVPFRLLKVSKLGHVVYGVGKEQLMTYPEFSYREERMYGEPYYPAPFFGREVPIPSHSSVMTGARCRGESLPWAWAYYPDRLRVSALMDQVILDQSGQENADLNDLLIGREGTVEQIILDIGGFLGLGTKLVAVDYRPLKVTDRGIVYNVTKEELLRLPAFHYGEK